MRCKNCKKRRDERTKRPRDPRQHRVATCDRCGEPLVPLAGMALGAGDGTLAQLARFGLAITGEPLLELKREGM
jgi:NAD-dependent SIR2 family protein deacetylase